MKKRKIMTVMLTAVLIIAMVSTGTLSVFSAVDVPTQNRIPEWAVLDGRNHRTLASTGANLPASYDLRDVGIVTPVKLQSPWDSCWSFGGIAAAEISILSALGTTYENHPLDLSERHLAYFAHKGITEDEDPSQAGEGLHMTNPAENAEFNGGDFGLITSIFSQGVGPVEESLFPYRGSAATYTENGWYSDADDWSIPAANETGGSNRWINSGFVLKDGNILPEYWNASKTNFTDGANAIKQELLNGRGVVIKYYADRSGKYAVSDTQNRAYFYGQYTFDDLSTDHDACIVGWDDNYDAANFSHTKDFYGSALTDGDDTPLSEDAAAALTTPPGNGAWIVKNSWGSETDGTVDDLGHTTGLSPAGIPDNNGKASGYFYLSYYDKTICGAETMNFSVDLSDDDQLTAMQYDYLPSQTQRFRFDDKEVISSANVFCADEPIELKSVSTATDKANTRVTFAIYRLHDGFQNPTDGELLYRSSQNFAYAGFHRFDLENPLVLATGQRFSIVSTASVVNDSGKRIYSVAANQSITEEGAHPYNKPTYGVAVVNQGESYLYQDGNWVDWRDKLTALRTQGTINEYQCIDNFSIKAYVVPAEETPSQDETQSPDDPQTATQPQPGSDIQPATPHEHLPLTAHAKVPATCGQAGTQAYWECETCHKLFSDANGYEKINAPVVIPATDNHTYGDPEWTWTNDLSAATATFTCSVCGDFHDEEGEVESQLSGENTEYTASVTFSGQTYTDKKVVDNTAALVDHRITVNCGNHATLTADKVKAKKGQTVNLTLTIEPGYRLKSWDLNPVDLVIENNSFVMPDSDVIVLALIEEIPWHHITVTTNGHGTASASVVQAQEGDTVTLNAAPDTDYILQDWRVAVGGVKVENNAFVMSTGDVEIEAVFAYGRYADNEDQLRNALNDGSDKPVFLQYDILAEGMTTVSKNKTAILDLNGHTLSRTESTILLVYGDLTLRDTMGGGKITGGTESGIMVDNGGILTMEGGEISGNSAINKGGGIYVKKSTLIMNGGSVCNNSTSIYGGGIYLYNSTMTMSGGTVSSNSSYSTSSSDPGRGGGIYLTDSSSLTMTGGVISGNSAAIGGGVYVYRNCSFKLTDGTISANTASTSGGGVYPTEFSTFNMAGGSVTGNRAPEAPAVMADGTVNLSGGSITGNIGTDSRYLGALRVITNNASLRMSGSPIIKDNFVGDQQSNVYLRSTKSLSITGELADTARIGVEKGDDGVFTSGLSGKGTLANFTSDNASKAILLNDSGEAYFINKVHTVTVTTNNSFGTASASASSAEGGTIVTLTAAPNAGFYLKEWVVVSGGVTIENNQFVMLYEPVEIQAVFAEITYPVTVTVEPPAGGTASASMDTAPRSQVVYLDATPSEGYRFKEWQVVSGSVTLEHFPVYDTNYQLIENPFGFIMPGEPVEVKAVFEKLPHPVTINYDTNSGTVTADKDEAAEGDIVTITVTPNEGYRLSYCWGSVQPEPTDLPGVFQLVMPASEVSLVFAFEPLYAIHTDGNVDVYRWDGLAVESITSAGGGDEVYIELKENAVPDKGKYFTGEYLVNGTSLGREGTDPWANYIDHFDMPDHAVTVAAVQADKQVMTVDLRSGEAVELSYDTFILLVTDDRIPRLYPDEGDDILFDLDNSGAPDVRLYYVEERDEDDVVTAITYYAVKADNADAVGRSTFDYTGNTVRYSTISFVLPGGVIRGDADGNGVVTIIDATIIQRKLASLHVSSFAEEAADATGDGELSILDATAIQRYLASLPTNEAIGQPMS